MNCGVAGVGCRTQGFFRYYEYYGKSSRGEGEGGENGIDADMLLTLLDRRTIVANDSKRVTGGIRVNSQRHSHLMIRGK